MRTGRSCVAAILAASVVPIAAPAFAQAHPVPPSEAVPEMRLATVYGQKMAYYDIGQGPVLVLVHGRGTSAAIDWGQLVKPLSQWYRVIAIDNIGYGRSGRPNIVYSARTFTNFLGELLRQMNIRNVSLAGESLGGQTVAYYALAAAQPGSDLPKVDKLVIVDGAIPTPSWPPGGKAPPERPLAPSWQDYKFGLDNYLFKRKEYATDAYAKDAWQLMISYDADAIRAGGQAMPQDGGEGEAVGKAFATQLRSIKVPTLIIWGDSDEVVPAEVGCYLHESIAGSRLIVVKQAGHAPGIERPDEVKTLLHDFLG